MKLIKRPDKIGTAFIMANVERKKPFYNFWLLIGISLLILWICIASVRLVFNISKMFTEEWQWLSFSDQQKREKLYGDIEKIYQEIDEKTIEGSNLYLFSEDGKSYFILRYLLYPTKVFWIKNIKDIHKISSNDYVLFYHQSKPKNVNNVLYIKKFNTDNNSSFLYKLL